MKTSISTKRVLEYQQQLRVVSASVIAIDFTVGNNAGLLWLVLNFKVYSIF